MVQGLNVAGSLGRGGTGIYAVSLGLAGRVTRHAAELLDIQC